MAAIRNLKVINFIYMQRFLGGNNCEGLRLLQQGYKNKQFLKTQLFKLVTDANSAL